MVEEFYGKISRSGSNLSDSLEDKLTGDFFGTLRYMEFCDGLQPILCGALRKSEKQQAESKAAIQLIENRSKRRTKNRGKGKNMMPYTENILQDSGVILACEDESIFSALARYYSHMEKCEPLLGMPVRQFSSESEQEDDTSIATEAVSLPHTMLISDAQAMTLPFEILRQQDILCIYRTASEGDFVACAERLTALQEDDGGILMYFADEAAAKACMIASGLWTPMNIQLIGADRRDILPILASTKGELRWISLEHLLWEEMPAANQTVRGVQLIFRGTGEELSLYDIAKKAESVADCFRGEVDLVWQVEPWEENEILMFSAYEMHHAGVASKDV